MNDQDFEEKALEDDNEEGVSHTDDEGWGRIKKMGSSPFHKICSEGTIAKAGVMKIKEIRIAIARAKKSELIDKFRKNIKKAIDNNPLIWDQIFLVNDLSFKETGSHNVKKKTKQKLEREDSLFLKKNDFIVKWAESVEGPGSRGSRKLNSQKSLSHAKSVLKPLGKKERLHKIGSSKPTGKPKKKSKIHTYEIYVRKKTQETKYFMKRLCHKAYNKLLILTIDKATIFQFIRTLKKSIKVWKPEDNFKVGWDLMGIVFILEELIMIPLVLAFEFDNPPELDQFNLFITIFFIIDMMINFNTGYYSKGTLVLNRKRIFKKYMTLWFYIDFLSSFPIDMLPVELFTDSDVSNNRGDISRATRVIRIVRFFRFAKLAKLLRILKLKKTLEKIEDYFQMDLTLNTLIVALKLICFIFYLAHWCACFFHYVAVYEKDEGVADTWITNRQYQDEDWNILYIRSLYWSITTMITVGYGDIIPVTWIEKIFAIVVMLLACGVFAFSMNTIGSIFQDLNQSSNETKKKMIEINNYMKKKDIPKELQARIRRHLEYIFDNDVHSTFSQRSFIDLLSKDLKEDVILNINRKVLLNTKFAMLNFSRKLLYEIPFIMKEKIFVPEDIIIMEETPVDNDAEIYFLSSGTVKVFISRTQTELATLGKDEIFGEIGFFSRRNRTASVSSTEFAFSFCLKRSEFLSLLEANQSQQDWEYFHEIRDKIDLYEDYTALYISCFACGEHGHVARECRKMHLIVNNYVMLQAKNFFQKRFLRSFKRKSKPKFNSRMKKQWLENIIFKLFEEETERESKQFSSIHTLKSRKSFKSRISSMGEEENENELTISAVSPTNQRKSAEEFSDIHVSSPMGTFSTAKHAFSPDHYQHQISHWDHYMLQLQNADNGFVLEERFQIYTKYFPRGNIDEVFKQQNEYVKERELTLQRLKKERQQNSPLKKMSVMNKKSPIFDPNIRRSSRIMFNFTNSLGVDPQNLIRFNSNTSLISPPQIEGSTRNNKPKRHSFILPDNKSEESESSSEPIDPRELFAKQSTKLLPKDHKRTPQSMFEAFVREDKRRATKISKSIHIEAKSHGSKNLLNEIKQLSQKVKRDEDE